jgi:CHAT domain-containing protein
VGGVDYDALPGSAPAKPKKDFSATLAARGDEPLCFKPLPGAKGELATIERIYRENFDPPRIATLEGVAASEAAFADQAPHYRFLHVATHGFFAPPAVRSALDRSVQTPVGGDWLTQQSVAGYFPHLLSGIALAGANRRTPDGDGIFTAEEVMHLDLAKTRVVVLSACETGLGESAGGEGLLGLQRAFQIAGARTVVASLWKVDDRATRDLMERFYENMWTREMGKAQALREAQIWMLRDRGPRGLVEVKEGEPEPPQRLPPYYWGAFVLSGEW